MCDWILICNTCLTGFENWWFKILNQVLPWNIFKAYSISIHNHFTMNQYSFSLQQQSWTLRPVFFPIQPPTLQLWLVSSSSHPQRGVVNNWGSVQNKCKTIRWTITVYSRLCFIWLLVYLVQVFGSHIYWFYMIL